MFDKPPDFGLPSWAIAAMNLAFYAIGIWCWIALYRASQGKERIVIAGWAAGILGFIRPLLPGDLAMLVRYAEVGGMIAATIAAAYIVFERPPKPDSLNRTSKAATAVLFGVALLLGFLIAVTESHSGWTSDGTTMAGLALGAAAFSLIDLQRPWLWALGVYAPLPVLYAIVPPRHPWVPSEPLSFPLNNRVGQSVFATIAFLIFTLAGAYLIFALRLLDRKIRRANTPSAS